LKGFDVVLAQIFINVGILLSYVSNYALAGLPVHIGWRVMYAIGVLPPVFLAAGVLSMPESPRWLAMRGRQAEARAVLVRTSDTAAEAELRLEEIKRVVEAPQEAGVGVWRELIFQPSAMVRRILVCAVGHGPADPGLRWCAWRLWPVHGGVGRPSGEAAVKGR
jgi:MFS family permease